MTTLKQEVRSNNHQFMIITDRNGQGEITDGSTKKPFRPRIFSKSHKW